jgi:hypothetical protein
MEASVAVTPQNGGIGGRNTAKWRHQWPQHRKIEASVTGNAVKSPIEIWRDIHPHIQELPLAENLPHPSDRLRQKWPRKVARLTEKRRALTKSHIEIWRDIHPHIQELTTKKGELTQCRQKSY